MNLKNFSPLLKCTFFLLAFLLSIVDVTAQEGERKAGKNTLSLSFGYAYVQEGTSAGGTEAEGIFVPSLGINYFRSASKYAKFGIMTDFEFGEYLVFNQDIERENVFIVVAVASYEFQEHFTLLGGIGREFDNNQQVPIVRVGASFPFELKKGWSIEPEFLFDFKEGYNVYTFGVGFGLNF